MLELESGKPIQRIDSAAIYPANLYVAPKDKLNEIILQIEHELKEHESYLESEGKYIEAKRIHERTNFDLEMIRELGYCSGIENYSRFLMVESGDSPFCLLDYFPDYLMFIDESYATIPQLRGMWGGDQTMESIW